MCASQKVRTLTTTYFIKIEVPDKKGLLFWPFLFWNGFCKSQNLHKYEFDSLEKLQKTLCLYICSTLYVGLGWANFEIYLFFIDSEDLKKRPKPNKKNALDCSEDGELIKKL